MSRSGLRKPEAPAKNRGIAFCGKIDDWITQMDNRTILEAERPAKAQKAAKKAVPPAKKETGKDREQIFDAFRRWGYYEATLDPLAVFQPLKHPDLELSGEAAEEARRIYCGNIGVEFMHLAEPERRRWIAERIEGPQKEVEQKKISRAAGSRRPFRAGSPGALSGHETFFARRRDFADSAA